MNKKIIFAHILLLFVAFFYGANYTISKTVMPEFIEPKAFVGIRIYSAVIFFWILDLLFIRKKVQKKHLVQLFLCGLLGTCANQLMFFEGLAMTKPISAAIIMLTTPIIVLLASVLFLKEKIYKKQVIGTVIGLSATIALITMNSSSTTNASNPLLGNLLVFLNAVSYSAYIIMVKDMMRQYPPITVVKWAFTFGALQVTPFAWNGIKAIDWSILNIMEAKSVFSQVDNQIFNVEVFWSVVFVVVCVTLCTYLFNATAINIVNPTIASTYIYLQPVFAAIIAVMMGKDSLTIEMCSIGALIFIGVFLVSTGKPKPKPIFEEKVE